MIVTYVNRLGFIFLLCTFGFAKADETPWEKYLRYPSSANAREIEKLSRSSNSDTKDYVDASELAILRLQVVAGDREAFRATYRLILKADGGELEDLIAILASSIRAQPKIFLEEALNLKMKSKIIESVLEMPGLEYVDRLAAQKYELTMRRIAINSVRELRIANTQRNCLYILDRVIKKM